MQSCAFWIGDWFLDGSHEFSRPFDNSPLMYIQNGMTMKRCVCENTYTWTNASHEMVISNS